MRAVLDANIVISGLVFPGNERQVLELARQGAFELYLSPFIMQEIAGVLRRKFEWSREQLTEALADLGDLATMVEPDTIAPVLEDNDPDNRVLACVASASADYLVTGDRRHLLPLEEHGDAKIVNSRQFLSELEGDS